MHAYAAGISPVDFWGMTPHELGLAARGMGLRFESMHKLAAWHLAPILNMVSEHRITPARLLGGQEIAPDRATLTRMWLGGGGPE